MRQNQIQTPELQHVAEQIAAMLLEAEFDIDGSLTSTASMLAQLPRLGARANLSAGSGQKVVHAATRAALHLAEARGAMSDVHANLEVLRRALKLPTHGGGTVKTPPDDFAWEPMGASTRGAPAEA